MVKRPVQWLSDLQQGDKKVTLNHLNAFGHDETQTSENPKNPVIFWEKSVSRQFNALRRMARQNDAIQKAARNQRHMAFFWRVFNGRGAGWLDDVFIWMNLQKTVFQNVFLKRRGN